MALFYTDKTGVDTSYTDPDIGDATTEEMMKMFEGWELQVEALIQVWSLRVCYLFTYRRASACPTHRVTGFS